MPTASLQKVVAGAACNVYSYAPFIAKPKAKEAGSVFRPRLRVSLTVSARQRHRAAPGPLWSSSWSTSYSMHFFTQSSSSFRHPQNRKYVAYNYAPAKDRATVICNMHRNLHFQRYACRQTDRHGHYNTSPSAIGDDVTSLYY